MNEIQSAAAAMGRVGGKSTSAAKIAAAKRNLALANKIRLEQCAKRKEQ